jgi:hypothetical protein
MAQAWFRYYRETITDPKFGRLTGGQRHLWTVLLCLSDDDGHVWIASGVPYDTAELAAVAGIESGAASGALAWLQSIGCIGIDDCGIHINNWDKRQFKSDTSTERVKKHRSKQGETFQKRSCNGPETETETETETDTDTSQGARAKPKRKVFKPPTVDEVEAYRREKELRLDAGAFVDFYAAKGWMVGTSKMKDWRAAARNWARRDAERAKPSGSYTGMTSEF